MPLWLVPPLRGLSWIRSVPCSMRCTGRPRPIPDAGSTRCMTRSAAVIVRDRVRNRPARRLSGGTWLPLPCAVAAPRLDSHLHARQQYYELSLVYSHDLGAPTSEKRRPRSVLSLARE